MKRAKKVHVPFDRPLALEEYDELSRHAYNSALYYTMNYGRNSNQIREKLYMKGYPKESVSVAQSDGTTTSHDMVEECIQKLKDLLILDDFSLAINRAESLLRQGKGATVIRSKLYEQKFSMEQVNHALDEVLKDEGAEQDALNRVGSKLLHSSSFQKLDTVKARQKAVRHLVGRGFSMSNVMNWVSKNFD